MKCTRSSIAQISRELKEKKQGYGPMPCSHKVTPPWSRAAQVMEIQEGADSVEAAVTPAGRLRLQEGQRVGGDAFFPYLFEGGSRKVSPWVMPIFCPLCSAASLQVVMLSPSLTPHPIPVPTVSVPARSAAGQPHHMECPTAGQKTSVKYRQPNTEV